MKRALTVLCLLAAAACNDPSEPPWTPVKLAHNHDTVVLEQAPVESAPTKSASDDQPTDEAQPPPPMPAPPKKPAHRTILVVGDSEACAVKPQIRHVKLATDTVHDVCKGATRVGYWGKWGHLARALHRYPHPDVLVVFLGTNHYWEKKAPDVKPILDIVKQEHMQCVWVGNTAVHGRHWAIDHLIEQAVTPTCTYFDTEKANIPLRDGVHPGPTGARQWLRKVWPVIPMKYQK